MKPAERPLKQSTRRTAEKQSTRRSAEKIQCTVPAKLIVSGEHAVLYGCPALSLAIALPTRCTLAFTPAAELRFSLHLNDIALHIQADAALWQDEVQAIEQRFAAFTQNTLAIQHVLTQPQQLIWMTLALFNRHTPLMRGEWTLTLDSEVPMGRGLGSSAAVIVATLAALFQAHDLPLQHAIVLEMAQHAEHYQHGRSSGIDPATLLTPGLLRFELGQIPQRLAPAGQPCQAWLIDTGAPDSTTGECVAAVRRFSDDAALWQRFAKVSAQIQQAWLSAQPADLKAALRTNHLLLCQIGVVPARVAGFIARLENDYAAAAKICGAGSLHGDSAGMVLCLSDTPPVSLCEAYGYRYFAMQTDNRGVHCEMV